jgi:excisionase family DNA binding protein
MNTSLSPRTAPQNCVVIHQFSKARTIAARLGVCPRTIFRWADEGKIARHKINARVVLFDEAEVVALMESVRVISQFFH